MEKLTAIPFFLLPKRCALLLLTTDYGLFIMEPSSALFNSEWKISINLGLKLLEHYSFSKNEVKADFDKLSRLYTTSELSRCKDEIFLP